MEESNFTYKNFEENQNILHPEQQDLDLELDLTEEEDEFICVRSSN